MQEEPKTARAAVDSAPILHRLQGMGLLAISGILFYIIFDSRIVYAKVLYVAPAFASIGVWMMAFGYPKRDDEMAPLWWRIGLVALTLTLFSMTLMFVDSRLP
jgi:hypothetical protein